MDLDGDSLIGFTDFLIFVTGFGKDPFSSLISGLTTTSGVFHRGSSATTSHRVQVLDELGSPLPSAQVSILPSKTGGLAIITHSDHLPTLKPFQYQLQGTFKLLDAIGTPGELYIADDLNHRIRIVSIEGIIETFAGSGRTGLSEGGFWGDNGPAMGAGLKDPSDVYADKVGNVYIADTRNNLIRKVDSTGVITTIAGRARR